MPNKKELDEILYLNPRINSKDKKAFELAIFTKKQEGFKLDMSKIARSLVEKFNEDPESVLTFLGITK